MTIDEAIDTLDNTPWPYIPEGDPPTVTLTHLEAQKLLKALVSGFMDTHLANRLAEELGEHICHPFEPRPTRRQIILAATRQAAEEQDLYQRGYAKGYEIGHDMGQDSGLKDGTQDGYHAGYNDGQEGRPPVVPTREPASKDTLFNKAKAKRHLVNVPLFGDDTTP